MNDARWMKSALALARRSLGQTWPNPAVGCIVVGDNRVLGRGATAPSGRPHAETIALAQAGDARGATVYVTLEPCAHHGLTPPCTDALIQAGVSRVVCATVDRDPRVAGRGLRTLKAADIAVDLGCCREEAEYLNEGFFMRVDEGRPRVLLKLATTLDGKIATSTGESRWITGPEARRRVHVMRAQNDAIMVGSGTAQADDPMLDVRGIGLASRNPIRVVLDTHLRLPLSLSLFRSAREIPVWLLHQSDSDPARRNDLAAAGVDLVDMTSAGAEIDLAAAMQVLGARGITRLMVEGGGRLAASLLRFGLVDEIALFSAGKVFGYDGLPSVHPFGLEHLEDAPNFELSELTKLKNDTLSFWKRIDG